MAAILTALFGLFGSILGGWISAQLSLRHFYKQRVWDRRADAYSEIFEALWEMSGWYEVAIKDIEFSRDLSDTEENSRNEAYRAARKRLERRLSRECWLVSDQVETRIRDALKFIDGDFDRQWQVMVFEGSDALWGLVRDLQGLAREDLNVRKQKPPAVSDRGFRIFSLER